MRAMFSKDFDILVVGGGIVGLSLAYELKLQFPGRHISLIEKERAISLHQTGRNSGVIHSGIYYAPGSDKAKNCLLGYNLLKDFCEVNSVSYEICGKLIVAHGEQQTSRLKTLMDRGEKNGLSGLQWFSSHEARVVEPHVNCDSALYVPQTGIIDFNLVASRLLELHKKKGEVLLNQKVESLQESSGKVKVELADGSTVFANNVLNCAGLQADRLAQGSLLRRLNYRIIPFKGEYLQIETEKRNLIRHLVYPTPDPEMPFLGLHFSRHSDGSRSIGPNALLSLNREGYEGFKPRLRDALDTFLWPGFYVFSARNFGYGMREWLRSCWSNLLMSEINRTFPEITKEDISYHHCGIRAQVVDRKGSFIDRLVILPSENGRIIHLLNTPSPAATSSFAIAKQVISQTRMSL